MRPPSSSRMALETSVWVISRPRPRAVPSRTRRRATFSPSFMANRNILPIVIFVKGRRDGSRHPLLRSEAEKKCGAGFIPPPRTEVRATCDLPPLPSPVHDRHELLARPLVLQELAAQDVGLHERRLLLHPAHDHAEVQA